MQCARKAASESKYHRVPVQLQKLKNKEGSDRDPASDRSPLLGDMEQTSGTEQTDAPPTDAAESCQGGPEAGSANTNNENSEGETTVAELSSHVSKIRIEDQTQNSSGGEGTDEENLVEQPEETAEQQDKVREELPVTVPKKTKVRKFHSMDNTGVGEKLDIVRKMSEPTGMGVFTPWQDIGPYKALKQKTCQRVYATSGRSDDIALFFNNGRFYAMEAWCTHMGKIRLWLVLQRTHLQFFLLYCYIINPYLRKTTSKVLSVLILDLTNMQEKRSHTSRLVFLNTFFVR